MKTKLVRWVVSIGLPFLCGPVFTLSPSRNGDLRLDQVCNLVGNCY
jgi:hypothetical protein